MADKKVTRLRFTKNELTDEKVRRAAAKAERAADRAENAQSKIPKKTKLRLIREAAGEKSPGSGGSGTEHKSGENGKVPASEDGVRQFDRPSNLGSKLRPEGQPKTGNDRLRGSTQSKEAMRRKLRFEKVEVAGEKPKRAEPAAKNLSRAAVSKAANMAKDSIGNEDDDNSGTDALKTGKTTANTAGSTVTNVKYSHKLKVYENAEKLTEKSDKANVDALYQKAVHDNPEAASNPISRWRQKQAIKKQYASAKRAEATAKGAAGASAVSGKASKAAKETKTVTDRAAEFVKKHPKGILIVLVLGFLVVFVSSTFSSCSVIFSGVGQGVLGTSYTAEETDINSVESDYTALETELRNEIDNIESTHPGYDEYRYNLAEIGHNPYELASYLTVLFEDYTRSEVQSALHEIFEEQYTLTLDEEVEIRTRTETRTGTTTSTDPETGETTTEEYEYEVEVEYEYYILNVTLTNKGIGAVVRSSGLTDDQLERYDVLMETRGNRDDLFADVNFAVPGEYTDYDIPGDALTDTKFANMVHEAEKYLGYPYVWGGSSPSTSFDCSGFVSWVINHCGNGWSVGRQTANGLKGCCDIIPPSSAEPGDLIFFQGTYDTSGASHVGIYVGNGMMIHCGNPISYASIETSYWQQHFYCFGRIRG